MVFHHLYILFIIIYRFLREFRFLLYLLSYHTLCLVMVLVINEGETPHFYGLIHFKDILNLLYGYTRSLDVLYLYTLTYRNVEMQWIIPKIINTGVTKSTWSTGNNYQGLAPTHLFCKHLWASLQHSLTIFSRSEGSTGKLAVFNLLISKNLKWPYLQF